MAALAFIALMLAMISASEAAWCVCRSEMTDAALQKTLDYACGAGADCIPIHQNGGCYNPNTVKAHCSYAANSYYQRQKQGEGSCDFQGTTSLTTTDPSYSGCSYPANPSAAGTSSGSAASTTGTMPGSFTPTNGVIGGFGPSSSISSDSSSGGFLLKGGMGCVLAVACSAKALFG